MMGQAFGMGAWMWLSWIALIALIVWAIWAVDGRRSPPSDDGSQDPIKTLKQRLASGEIDTEEYRRLRDELNQ